jgi:adenylate cyclase
VRCAIEVQNDLLEHNDGVPPARRIEYRVGIHLGDVVEEADGDLMGDSVNIAARIEGIAEPGAICLSEDAYRQVKGRLDLAVTDLGATQLKNIAEPIRVYSVQVGLPAQSSAASDPSWAEKSGPPRLSIVVLPFGNISDDPGQEYFVDGVTECLTTDLSRMSGMLVIGRNTAFTYKGKAVDLKQVGREWMEPFSAMAIGCALTCSSWTLRPALTSGPTGSTSVWPPFSTCRTRSSLAWPTRLTLSS